MPRSRWKFPESLWRRMDFVEGPLPTMCVLYTGSLAPAGYGRLTVDQKPRYAHRLSYEMYVGPIPQGMHVDHLCRNRACINPDHLEVVTPAENKRRGVGPAAVNARKTHCPKGHPYDDENTIRRSNRVSRECRTCAKEQTRRRYWRNKEAA